MPNFERSSLNQKLTILSLLSTATALLFVFAAFAVSSVINHRQDEGMQLASFARVIGAASASDLLLVDRNQAQATLAALEAQRGISAAVLYDRLAARGWTTSTASMPPPWPRPSARAAPCCRATCASTTKCATASSRSAW